MSEDAVIGLFVATVQFGTLVFLAALGELIAERAGVLNLGVEGMMAMGAVSGVHGRIGNRESVGGVLCRRGGWRIGGRTPRPGECGVGR